MTRWLVDKMDGWFPPHNRSFLFAFQLCPCTQQCMKKCNLLLAITNFHASIKAKHSTHIRDNRVYKRFYKLTVQQHSQTTTKLHCSGVRKSKQHTCIHVYASTHVHCMCVCTFSHQLKITYLLYTNIVRYVHSFVLLNRW